ncbi:MAG TPA: DUF3142 domain-containing protein [Thermoanaerobaculia bacterium]|nr:DUF3142 domain-containing protein [Thermoanaerobaculia bacterium]
MKTLPFLCLALVLSGCNGGGERAAGPLRQEAYVWQRSWTPAVRDAARQSRDFAGLVVLAAEVDLRNPAPRVVRVPLDGEALKGRPVGAALRVTAFRSTFKDEPRIARLLQSLVRDVAAEAKAKGLALSEIQIDYDCPERKLADYRDLLPSLRQAAAPAPLTITALPTWIHQRRAFRRLIEQADGYVLQLHSVRPPTAPGEAPSLINATQARGSVELAAEVGRPFRAALPTYGYTVAYDTRGRLVGILAEGPLLSWSPEVMVRTLRSDPAAMAELIRGWTRDRPAELSGVIWYRLPVAGDRLNWSRSTLKAVAAGRTPKAAIHPVLREPEPGLVEIDLVNDGEAEARWPSPVRIRWRGEAPIAADGLAVYRMLPRQDGEVRLQGTGSGLLRPGNRRTIAWLRFAQRTEVQVELP